MNRHPRRRHLGRALVAVLLAVTGVGVALPAHADGYVAIAGSGSTWSQNALDQWRRNVAGNYGMTVNYTGNGSSAGRTDFINGAVDFAISEIPFQAAPEDNSAPEVPGRGYAYLPIVAGGTSLMYNLKAGGKQVTNLQLTGEIITKIFTGQIKTWDDPAIAAVNPGLALPSRKITPVVRSDGSGSTAQFTKWMSTQYHDIWSTIAPGMTSYFPASKLAESKAQNGSLGVAGYVSADYGEGAITYVEYSYALKSGLPVASVQNASGAYVQPTAANVATALTQAKVNKDASSPDYLTQILDGVYNSGDPTAYPISSYSYMIIPTEVSGIFTAQKGGTLGAFVKYILCEGQDQAGPLGYSPLPNNLVQDAFEQIQRIPGANVGAFDGNTCKNAGAAPDGSGGGGTGSGGSGGGGAGAAAGTGTAADAGTGTGTGAAQYDANGNLISGSAGGGAAAVSAPFALAATVSVPAWVGMGAAAAVLLAVVLLPPLFVRRTKR